MSFSLSVYAPEATSLLAGCIGRLVQKGDCITLRGDLGSGKTTFARGFIHVLSTAPEEVTSPTFTLAQSYSAQTARGQVTLWHFDLYRLKQAEEVLEIGLEEALESGITLIEWPEMVESLLPVDRLDISLSYGTGAQERVMHWDAKGHWKARLMML